ncbi:hypothetical protein ES705_11361 [subsurface metagenome]
MKLNMKALFFILFLGISSVVFSITTVCEAEAELKRAISSANPGDTIMLSNRVWNDLSIEFFAEGTSEAPIVLCSEEFGKVFLESESYLMICGTYLIVDGLIFRNGHSPKSAVISFKKSSERVANNCRVTNCVIDQFSNTDRYERNYWVALYGKNNRLDHCYLSGKLNYGSTITIWLRNEASAENKHRIDHNYIGHRPRLGSNGGETIRIGSSKNSMVSSQTVIENNYFEHCNGETEIVSVKACDNIIQNNTFYECEGSLVLRHGNGNVVRGNLFNGNRLPYTGGIRVIGEDHKIYNNYFEGLRGKEFRAPLVLMNGIPDSPPNRYFQVQNVTIAYNSWIDCEEPWLFGMGIKDESITIPPANTVLAYNLIYSDSEGIGIITFDDISSIKFIENVFSSNYSQISLNGIQRQTIVLDTVSDFKEVKCNNRVSDKKAKQNFFCLLDYSEGIKELAGCPGAHFEHDANNTLIVASEETTGPENYKALSIPNYVPYTINIKPGNGTLDMAIEEAKPGAVIELTAGEYIVNDRLKINHPIIVRAESTDNRPVIKQHEDAGTKIFFEINYGGDLKLQNLILDGESNSSNPTKYAVTSAKEKMAKPYGFEATNCVFHSFTSVNEGGAIFKAYKGSFADSIIFNKCEFINVYRGFDLDEETDDNGIYNAEHVLIFNTLFQNVESYAISFYRGGKDESTFGPHLTIDHCVFDNVNNKSDASILQLVGVQKTHITNSVFYNSPNAKYVVELYGKYNSISHCNIFASGQIGVENGAVVGSGMLYQNPMFKEGYNLKTYSLLIGKAHDGGDIGLLKQQ